VGTHYFKKTFETVLDRALDIEDDSEHSCETP